MALFFLDSSAVVKQYVRERGTPWVIQLTHPSKRNALYLAHTTCVEVTSAVVRRHRAGVLSAAQAAQILGDFRFDLARQYRLIGITPSLIEAAMVLAERHGLRGYDAIQLAAVLQTHSRFSGRYRAGLTLMSADAALNAAAQLEGVTVDDPNAHP